MFTSILSFVCLTWQYRKNIKVNPFYWKNNWFRSAQFEDIIVTPIRKFVRPGDLARLSGGVTFIGGPIWPKIHPFWVRTLRRHGIFYIISDAIDDDCDLIDKLPLRNIIQEAVWCGPVFNHFGHMILDFMGRVAVSAKLNPNIPLLFSIPYNVETKKYVPKFFWEIVQILGAKKENVCFINTPTLVKKLLVYPQAECLGGGVPSAKYLSLLDSLSKREEKIYDYVYFSRGAFYSGGIAGERYFEKIMGKAGVLVVRPEEHSVEIQYKLCKQAKTLILTEGSAIHILQLLGYDAVDNVVVLSRRKNNFRGSWFCINLIKLRATTINYVNAIDYMLVISDRSMAMAILNKDVFILKLKALGINLVPLWNDEDYGYHITQDIISWMNIECLKHEDDIILMKKVKRYKNDKELIDFMVQRKAGFSMYNQLISLGIVDFDYYLAMNHDVFMAGVNPYNHFLSYGINELRNPSVYFDLKYYVENNLDVKHLKHLELLLHYFKIGWQEGRDPNSYFDTKFYLCQYRDSMESGLDPLQDYLKNGWRKNFNPNPEFNVKSYLEEHHDVALSGVEPLKHYIENLTLKS